MTDGAGSEYFSYDPLGHEWTEQRTTNGHTKTTTYTYNLDGSMASLAYPSGRVITYTPDSAGRPSAAQDVANGITYASGSCANGVSGDGVCYTPSGATSQEQFGTNLVSTLFYNDRLQPCRITATAAGTAPTSCADGTIGNILDATYNFNLGSGDNGNVIGIANNVSGQSGRSQLFVYDTLNRIIMAGTTATSGSGCWGEIYSYDAWGNLGAISAQGGYTGCSQENMNVTVNGNNQLSNFTYDGAGNTVNDGVNTYAWNAESEMSSSNSSVSYAYDGDGDRVEKSNGKMYWYGAGTEILDESDLSGNLTTEYVFFGGKRIAGRDLSSGNIYYYIDDFLGSTSKMVQAGQTSTCFDADFYPFGGERDYSTSCNPIYKFEGKERDTETQNDDFGARYYSWRFGRWLSADWSAVPVAVPYATLENPQTLNLYAMVADNPETDADLDGHMWDICHNAYDCSGVVSSSAGSEQDPEDAANFAANPQQMATKQEEQKAQRQSAQSLAAQIPAAVKSAIMNSVNASNAPSGADKTGGFHEEGGIAGTDASGGLVISPAKPGAYSPSGVVSTTLAPVDPSLNASMTAITVSWHVHPNGRTAAGDLAWNQPPSMQDQSVAAAEHQAVPGLIHIVVGAGNKQVYFYNGDGKYQQMSLKKFMRNP